jgi:hypothetical protein
MLQPLGLLSILNAISNYDAMAVSSQQATSEANGSSKIEVEETVDAFRVSDASSISTWELGWQRFQVGSAARRLPDALYDY